MFRGFNLETTADFSKWYSSGLLQYEGTKANTFKKLKDYLTEGGALNGEQLQKDWFPQISADIFLSHSHRDFDQVVGLAGYLYDEFHLNVFVDSCIWGNSEKLLYELDTKYCKKDDGYFSYEKRNDSTSHVHMMLSTSLTKMIDKTECFMFLNTGNSLSKINPKDVIGDVKTKSPWIYSELETSRMIQKKQGRSSALLEKSEESTKMFSKIEVEYSSSIDHLDTLNVSDLNEWWEMKKNFPTDFHSLDLLYKHIKDRPNV